MEKGLKVLLVASESAPFVKSGGLGDVVGSLPKALQKKNVDVRVVIPRHRVIKNETMYGVEFLGEFDVYLQWRKQRAKVLVKPGEVPVYFIENDYYFSRGALYGFDDDNERFAFFGKAVLDMLAMLDFYPDVIHCNDWQTGPVCMYLKEMYNNIPKSKHCLRFIICSIRDVFRSIPWSFWGYPTGHTPILNFIIRSAI